MTLLKQCIDDYLNWLRHEKGATDRTSKTYHASLYHFLGWATENGYPEPTLDDFTTALTRRYLYHQSGRGLRPRTIRGYVAPLRSMGAFLLEHGAIKENVALAVTLPRKDAAQRKVTSPEEIAALLTACERQREPKKVALSRAIVSVFVFGALRGFFAHRTGKV